MSIDKPNQHFDVVTYTGNGASAGTIYSVNGIKINSDGDLYVADGDLIRTVSLGGAINIFAGSTYGTADGTGTSAQFGGPAGLHVTSDGTLYVADYINNRIRKVTKEGVVTTLTGANSGIGGYQDGTLAEAKFNFPTALTIDSSGNIFICDNSNSRIRKITPEGIVSTFAGSGDWGAADGTGTAASFKAPWDITIGSDGNLYVVDDSVAAVRKITPAGVVTTIAGSSDIFDFSNGTGTAARFSNLTGITADASGNLYVVDQGNHAIRKIVISTAVVTTLAGTNTAGYLDATGTSARFNYPYRVCIDSSNNLYVTEINNYCIRKITPAGVVTTLAGQQAVSGQQDSRIINVGFKPDFVWIKSRSAATDHALYDSVRGAAKDLVSNSTSAETTTQSTGVTAFKSNGFAVGNLAKINTNAATYVAWCWKAGGTAVTNTAGTITAQVSANPTAGFSVAKFNTTAVASQTWGHGLGVAPSLVITRWLDAADNWYVYHAALPGKFLIFNSVAAAATSATAWGTPTSSVMAFGSSFASAHAMVAYCWSEVPGFSKFGSYTGNGSADGPFVYCGFRPRFVLIKRTDATASWILFDSTRNTYNIVQNYLLSDTAGAEGSGVSTFDFVSNGFKMRSTLSDSNANAGTYIYAAFAESPFEYSLGR